MNLKELQKDVNFAIENLREYESPENIQVLITLSERSAGARASAKIQCASMGFDFEHGQFRIEPERAIVREGNSFIDVMEVICKEYDGRNYYFCPRCDGKINKNDKFCRYCGQKIRYKQHTR